MRRHARPLGGAGRRGPPGRGQRGRQGLARPRHRPRRAGEPPGRGGARRRRGARPGRRRAAGPARRRGDQRPGAAGPARGAGAQPPARRRRLPRPDRGVLRRQLRQPPRPPRGGLGRGRRRGPGGRQPALLPRGRPAAPGRDAAAVGHVRGRRLGRRVRARRARRSRRSPATRAASAATPTWWPSCCACAPPRPARRSACPTPRASAACASAELPALASAGSSRGFGAAGGAGWCATRPWPAAPARPPPPRRRHPSPRRAGRRRPPPCRSRPALEVDERPADQAAAQAAHQDRHERQHPGGRRGQGARRVVAASSPLPSRVPRTLLAARVRSGSASGRDRPWRRHRRVAPTPPGTPPDGSRDAARGPAVPHWADASSGWSEAV